MVDTDSRKLPCDNPKWGSEDQLGSANELTPEVVLRAFTIQRQGKVYDLSEMLDNNTPSHPVHGPLIHYVYFSHQEGGKWMSRGHEGSAFETFSDRVDMPLQIGTHIDALCHVSIADRMYNGFSAKGNLGTQGSNKLGIEQVPPIVTRGLLLDVAAYKGCDCLEGRYKITVQDLESTLRKEKIAEVERGDAILLHTGWHKAWRSDRIKYTYSSPGLGLSSAKWLVERGVVAIGADNLGLEVFPYPIKGLISPVHQYLLVQTGTYIVENLVTEEFVAVGAYEFLFVCVPLKFRGGCGCAVRPLAII